MSFMKNILTRDPAQSAPLIQGATAEQATQSYGNTQQALAQQQAFLQALQGQNGIQNQSAVYNQLGQVVAGQGPNPAQAMLAQNTQANIANQAAMAAGQRGAAQNVGLIARQAGMQGGNLQQQSVGQGASMQAQQSLNALGQQGNMAGQMVSNEAGANQNYANTALNQQSNVLNSINGQNQASVGNQANVNQANSAIIGGVLSGAGAAMGKHAHGGVIEDPSGPKSLFAKHKRGIKMAEGGEVPAMLSPGEIYVAPEKVENVAAGANAKEVGRKIPGQAKVKGDSLKNDIVPARLETGGVVIPRTVAAKDNDAASKFVQSVLAKGGLKGKK
jgi:hypothetical protein